MKFLCRVGLHNWIYTVGRLDLPESEKGSILELSEKRRCECGKKQSKIYGLFGDSWFTTPPPFK